MEVVCKWFKGLKLTADYSNLITKNAINGAVLGTMKAVDFFAVGVVPFIDVQEICSKLEM